MVATPNTCVKAYTPGTHNSYTKSTQNHNKRISPLLMKLKSLSLLLRNAKNNADVSRTL